MGDTILESEEGGYTILSGGRTGFRPAGDLYCGVERKMGKWRVWWCGGMGERVVERENGV